MAQYRAGRVTVTLNSETVTGTDTDWVQAVDPGDVFLIRGDEVSYRVASVVSNTSLRLNAKYAGPTQTNATYSITRDFTPNLNLPIIRNGDVDAVALFAESLVILDSKWKAGGGTGGGSSTLAGLTDVNVTGSLAGDNFTKLANGSFGFVRPYVFTLTVDQAAGSGGRIVKSYDNGTLALRRINVAGGTVTENPDDVTINIPAPGEVNTLATAGTTASQTLVVAKSGTTLRVKGVRASGSITLTPEGNDLVIGSTATGTGTPVTYTMAPIGTGVSLVGTPSGTELRVKTLTFDSNFTVAQPLGAGVTVALNSLPITQISTVLWNSVAVGQVLYRNAANNIVGLTLPAAGLASLAQDAAPALGGNLSTNGKSILGVPGNYSGHIETPKVKLYTLDISSPAGRTITSLTAATGIGSVSFSILVDDEVAESLSGTTSVTPIVVIPSITVSFQRGSRVQLRLNQVDPLAADFVFSLSYQSA